jgi:hypothetical protein
MRLPRWSQRSRPTTPTGPATISYPELPTPAAAAAFGLCEDWLIYETWFAAKRARDLDGLGAASPSFVVPWIISPTHASTGVAEETKGRGPSRGDMQEVVDWLVLAGALRPLTESQRAELVRAGEARRLARDPEGRFRSLEPEHAAAAEAFYREMDRDSWEVIPHVMVKVYPELRTTKTKTAWADLPDPERP